MLKPALWILSLALWVSSAAVQAAGVPRMVADLNTTGSNEGSGVYGPLVPFGNKVLFPAHTYASGIELWQSDGTSVGTAMVRDLCAGACSSDPKPLGTVGRFALFGAKLDLVDRPRGDLWRTDGTRGGTVQVVAGLEICEAEHQQSAAIGGSIVFPAQAPGENCGVWRSDGTPGGTRKLLSLGFFPGISNPLVEGPVQAGNRLFLLAPDNSQQVSLWTTDGTSASLLRSFPVDSNVYLDFPRLLTALGSRVFFLARGDNSSGEELWTSDGTPAGTRPVTQFATPYPFAATRFLKALDGVLYFVADDVTSGGDLFRSDGTVAGTRRVTDFGFAFPFGGSGFGIGVDQIGKAGNRLVFLANDGLSGWRLWTSGGTPATTEPLAGCPGGCPGVDPTARITMAGGRVVFTGSDAAHGRELWSTDGTGAGTRPLGDFCPGSCSSEPKSFFLGPSGKLFFLAGVVGVGQVLWLTDGTPQGTSRLATSVGFENPAAAGGRIFFLSGDPRLDRQLWVTDGTAQGTGPVTLIGSGPSSIPAELTPFGNGLAFTAYDGQERRLWRSDGTEAGTGVLPWEDSINSSTGPSLLTLSGGLLYFVDPSSRLWRTDGTAAGTFPLSSQENRAGALFVFQGKVVFALDSGTGPGSVWQTDGTLAGTRVLFAPPPEISSFRIVRALGSRLYLLATTSSSVEQLWTSDGTQAGTHPLTNFESYAFDFRTPPEMAALGSTVYFVAGSRLWKTDGTMEGTSALLPPSATQEGYFPLGLTVFQGALYFNARTQQGVGPAGTGLWRSDGTAAGTVLLKGVGAQWDFHFPEPPELTPVGNQLLFVADDGVHGLELWRTDGTTAGTVLVRDIAAGSGSSHPHELTAAGGLLYFSANDGPHGIELWQSDGTAAGTRLVRDIAPGELSSHPEELTVSGHQLFFRADDGIHGTELWALDLTGAAGCQPSNDVLCLGGRYRVEASWRDFQGHTGRGHAASLTADTGTFWFFNPANVEVILKVLDGRGVNGHDWVFYGALSNVEYSLTVTDTQTGASRLYRNPPGRLASVADTTAFGPQGATGASGSGVSLGPAGIPTPALVAEGRTAEKAACAPSSTRLCLQGGRFAVEARWRDPQGHAGVGTAVPLAGGDTGYFWFFNAANVEVLLKVLDGRPLNNKFWVFYGALSDVEYTLTVTDTQTGKVKTYSNPQGRLASVADTGAF